MTTNNLEITTLAGGCFWCIEAVFEQLQGVEKLASGCTGRTGHAEAVQITFDPDVISFKDILDVFFTLHDPTTLNRHGPDVGTQYRSSVFYHTEGQKAIAEQTIRRLEESGVWGRPIITKVKPVGNFCPAEEYHQRYYRRNSNQPYCSMVIAPKVAKLRNLYLSRLKKQLPV